MHINKDLLFAKLEAFLRKNYLCDDKELIIELCRRVIFNDPTEACVLKTPITSWEDLPKDKSLFYTHSHEGLPIGNLTSQIFANFYMNDFDHFMKNTMSLKWYGRYVDDFIVLGSDKAALVNLMLLIEVFLKTRLHLTLHPKKRHLQSFEKGVNFLGVVIKPHRIITGSRTIVNFKQAVFFYNTILEPLKKQRLFLQSQVNSYLGLLKPYKTFYLRKALLKTLSHRAWSFVRTSYHFTKIKVL